MDNQNSRKDGKLNRWGVKGGKAREREGERRDELEIADAVGSQ